MKSPADVVVGQTYDVPCVYWNQQFWPVLLPAHNDSNDHCLMEIGGHYHIDFRFTHKRPSDMNGINAILEHVGKPLIIQMMAHSDFTHSFDVKGESAFFFVNRWYRQSSHLKAKNRVCAHNGVALVNKCGVCPAHGLAWNLNTEQLIDFKLPFYLQLRNKNKEDGPKGEIVGDTCDIRLKNQYRHDGRVVMIDSEDRVYPNMTQILTARHYVQGDIVRFHTNHICRK